MSDDTLRAAASDVMRWFDRPETPSLGAEGDRLLIVLGAALAASATEERTVGQAEDPRYIAGWNAALRLAASATDEGPACHTDGEWCCSVCGRGRDGLDALAASATDEPT